MNRIVICLLTVLAVLTGSAGAQTGVVFVRDSNGASVDQAFQLKKGAGNATANSVALNAALRNANQFHTLTFPAGDWYFAEDTTNANVNGTCILMDGKSGAALCGQGLYRPENEPGT